MSLTTEPQGSGLSAEARRLIQLARAAGLVELHQTSALRRQAAKGAAALHAALHGMGIPAEVVTALERLGAHCREAGPPSLGVPLTVMSEAAALEQQAGSAPSVSELAGATVVLNRRGGAGGHSPPRDMERYVLRSLLGRGGMGEVWLGDDRELGRPVAVKFLAADLIDSSPACKRFIEEAQLMGQLEHPVIPPIHDSGVTPQGHPFFVMRVVEDGRNLHDGLRMARSVQRRLLEGQVSPVELGGDQAWDEAHLGRMFQRARLLSIVRLIGYGVASAHARGVLHRDIKPANVVIGPAGEPLLLDWGLAKLIDQPEWAAHKSLRRVDEHTQLETRGAVGTPGYASPEQSAGRLVDERSDVYALGCLLYEVLTFSSPFGRHRGFTEELAAMQEAGPQRASLRAPWARVPASLELVCSRAMAARPEGRHQTVMALVEDIESYLEGTLDASYREQFVHSTLEEAQELAGGYREARDALPDLAAEIQRAFETISYGDDIAQKLALDVAREAHGRTEERKRVLHEQVSQSCVTILELLGGEESPGGARRLEEQARGLLAELAEERLAELEEEEIPRPLEERRWEHLLARARAGAVDRGALALVVEPPGSWQARLHRIGCRAGRPVWLETRDLELPVPQLELPAGQYHVEIAREDEPTTHTTFRVHRGQTTPVRVGLYSAAQIGPGMIHVPAGDAIIGGDPLNPSILSTGRRTLHVPDFFIGRLHVTCTDYLEFLDDLGAVEAAARAPRDSTGQTAWIHDGRWRLPTGPARFCDEPWHADWPVMGVSFLDATAYAEWRSGRDGRRYDLPTDVQYEKAARGGDGRLFPMRPQLKFLVANIAHRTDPAPAPRPAGSSPEDVSPYGVCDLLGNASDYVHNTFLQDPRHGIRGGAWRGAQLFDRVTSRIACNPDLPMHSASFRLVSAQPAPG